MSAKDAQDMTPPSKAHPTPPPLIDVMARAACEDAGWNQWEHLQASEADGESSLGKAEFLSMIRAALKAADDAGFVLVPKEPTSEMMTAWWPLIYSQTDAAGFKSGWAQMIAVVQRDRSDT